MVHLPERLTKPGFLKFKSDTKTKELCVVGNYLYCSVYIVVALRGLTHIRTSVALALYKKRASVEFLPQRAFWMSVLRIQVTVCLAMQVPKAFHSSACELLLVA